MNWLTIQETAALARRSVRTMNRAAANGALHTHQAAPGGKRVVAEGVTDIWLQGGSEAAQRAVCGCMRVASQRRSA